ncbi:MAG: hypothetical protein ACKVWR_18900 [Acidimicrobiales bacterium]
MNARFALLRGDALDAGEGLGVRRRLRLVRRERRRLRRDPGLLGTAAMIAVFLVLLALATLNAVLAQGQLRLDQLDRRIAERTADYNRARIEAARLEAPDLILARAAELGLTPPARVIYVDPVDTATPLPAPPTTEAPPPAKTGKTGKTAQTPQTAQTARARG